MAAGSKHPGTITFLLLGLVLLVTAVGISCVLPLTECPACSTSIEKLRLCAEREEEEVRANRRGKTVLASPVCMHCKDKRRVTLLRKLTYYLRAQ
jgi:hypothetical protein